MLTKYLGDAIRLVRIDRKMSQEELAFKFGEITGAHSIRKHFIDDLETGKRRLSFMGLAQLCQVMRCLMSDLIRVAEELEFN